MPLLLPSKLFPWMIQHGIFPKISTDLVANYWRHLGAVGSPLRHMSPNQDHIPMYVWGDGAQYTESGESMMVFSCGIVIDPKRTNIFPLFLCREATRHNEYHKLFFVFLKRVWIFENWPFILHWSRTYIHIACEMCLKAQSTGDATMFAFLDPAPWQHVSSTRSSWFDEFLATYWVYNSWIGNKFTPIASFLASSKIYKKTKLQVLTAPKVVKSFQELFDGVELPSSSQTGSKLKVVVTECRGDWKYQQEPWIKMCWFCWM